MKIKKVLVIVLEFVIMLILNSTKVNAIVARVVYNPVNVSISNIMRIVPLFLSIIYIVGGVIYYIKSKQDKKHKTIKLIIWLLVISLINAVLYFCADIVFEAGAEYSSRPMNF